MAIPAVVTLSTRLPFSSTLGTLTSNDLRSVVQLGAADAILEAAGHPPRYTPSGATIAESVSGRPVVVLSPLKGARESPPRADMLILSGIDSADVDGHSHE